MYRESRGWWSDGGSVDDETIVWWRSHGPVELKVCNVDL